MHIVTTNCCPRRYQVGIRWKNSTGKKPELPLREWEVLPIVTRTGPTFVEPLVREEDPDETGRVCFHKFSCPNENLHGEQEALEGSLRALWRGEMTGRTDSGFRCTNSRCDSGSQFSLDQLKAQGLESAARVSPEMRKYKKYPAKRVFRNGRHCLAERTVSREIA